MSEEILLTVTPARVVVDPGGTAQVVLQIQNRTAVVDDFVVDVLGDAANWTTLDNPKVPIFPDGVGTVQATIHPPRAASPAAGSVAVGFRVRSSVNPTLSSVEECNVVVQPFVEIAGEIAPKTARGRFSATHRLRVINKGNAPVNVSVRAEVQQGDANIAVPAGSLLVPSGQASTSKIKVRPSSSRWQGADEMHSYRLNIEPQGGAPLAIDAMMRQRPILGIPIATLLIAALLVVGGLAVYGKGPGAPIRTALRWTGVVDQVPSPSPSTETLPSAASTQQATQGQSGQSGQTVVKPPSPSAPASSSPSSTPTQPPASPAVTPPLTVNPIVLRPTLNPIFFVCVPLSSATLTDTVTTTHTLTWKGNATCTATYTGTITASYAGIRFTCSPITGTCLRIPFSSSHVYSITGLTGTQTDTSVPIGTTSVSYTLSLTDGSHTVTATAT